jgi:hypothetical protein
VSNNPAVVADSESLRRAALLASWQRDRSVAKRRLWWRWTVWVIVRFVLPAAVLLAGIKAWLMWTAPGPESRLPGMVSSRTLESLVPNRQDSKDLPAKPAPTSQSTQQTKKETPVAAAPSLPSPVPVAPTATSTAAPPAMATPAPTVAPPSAVPDAAPAATPVTLRLDWQAPPASKTNPPPAPRKKPTGANRP